VHDGLVTGLNESGRSAVCADVWTFHDPAVRVPSTYYWERKMSNVVGCHWQLAASADC